MTPLKPASLPTLSDREKEDKIKTICDATGRSPEEVEFLLNETYKDKVYLNDIYQVNVRKYDTLVHLSIKRIDKQPITDWRDKQDIKNQLVGRECEGVELYPAESRLVDTANQFHLWCYNDPRYRFPFGWEERLVSSESGAGAVQRPHEQSTRDDLESADDEELEAAGDILDKAARVLRGGLS